MSYWISCLEDHLFRWSVMNVLPLTEELILLLMLLFPCFALLLVEVLHASVLLSSLWADFLYLSPMIILCFLCWRSACISRSMSITSLLSPLHFVNVLLVEDSLDLSVLLMKTSSGKPAATVEFKLGLASKFFLR